MIIIPAWNSPSNKLQDFLFRFPIVSKPIFQSLFKLTKLKMMMIDLISLCNTCKLRNKCTDQYLIDCIPFKHLSLSPQTWLIFSLAHFQSLKLVTNRPLFSIPQRMCPHNLRHNFIVLETILSPISFPSTPDQLSTCKFP